ncbi:MAG: type II toxin-antitoxin system PemK/MazF family toxin [Treponema sp.]|nr:type II toxin-antitoxin system PemK/MazF family toxin [Treponema sp.]
MKRGDLYRVYRGSRNDPKEYRVFLVVSRQLLVNSRFSTVICAPVYSRRDGLPTQIEVGVDEGLKHESSIHCDELISIRKTLLTDYVGSVSSAKMEEVNAALRIALAVA